MPTIMKMICIGINAEMKDRTPKEDVSVEEGRRKAWPRPDRMWYRWDWSIEGCPQLLAVKEIADWTYSIRLFKGWSSGRKAYDLSKWTKRTRVPYTLGAEPFGHRIEYENRVRVRSCLTGVDLRMESLETNQSILCRHLSNWCQQPTEIQNANT